MILFWISQKTLTFLAVDRDLDFLPVLPFFVVLGLKPDASRRESISHRLERVSTNAPPRIADADVGKSHHRRR